MKNYSLPSARDFNDWKKTDEQINRPSTACSDISLFSLPAGTGSPLSSQSASKSEFHQGQPASNEPNEPNALPVPRRALSVWWPELLACVLVVGSFAALVGTVYPYQDEPLPRWPYGLSINTLISIYSIVFDMSAMMVVSSGLGQLKYLWFQKPRQLSDLGTFDQGSKGAWGALILLWVLRTRHALASVGALVIVLTLFVAPFSQQIVRYYPCFEIDSDVRATIPRANIAISTGGRHLGAGISNVDLPAQAAINMGIYDDRYSQVSPFCPTGNCTFDAEYASAGYCHRCQDLTDQTVTQDGIGSSKNLTIPGWDISSDATMRAFVLGPGMTSSLPSIRMIYGITDDTLKAKADARCPGGIKGGDWTCLGFGAAECSITPCVRRYRGAMSEGIFTENVTSKTTDLSHPSRGLMASTVDMSCVNAAERDYLRSQNYVFDNSTSWMPINLTQQIFSDYNGSSDLRDECVYQSTIIDASSLQRFFDLFFSGYLMGGGSSLGEGTTMPGRALFNQGLLNFTHFDTKFDHLAIAMTAYVRTGASSLPSNASVAHEGEVQRVKTCVQVRWKWLSLEAALVCLVLIFFMATLWILRSGGDQSVMHDFKTSVLPLLFHRLEGEHLETCSRDAQTVSKIESQAKHIHVKLARDESGWRFTETTSK